MVIDDFKLGWRQLIKSPGFSITAILTLALAIGANTAVFSLVDAVLLKPLPYPQPERLAMVSLQLLAKRRGDRASGRRPHRRGLAGDQRPASRRSMPRCRRACRRGSVWSPPIERSRWRRSGSAPDISACSACRRAIGREFTADEDVVGGAAGRRVERSPVAFRLRRRPRRRRRRRSCSRANRTRWSASCRRRFAPASTPICGRRSGRRRTGEGGGGELRRHRPAARRRGLDAGVPLTSPRPPIRR